MTTRPIFLKSKSIVVARSTADPKMILSISSLLSRQGKPEPKSLLSAMRQAGNTDLQRQCLGLDDRMTISSVLILRTFATLRWPKFEKQLRRRVRVGLANGPFACLQLMRHCFRQRTAGYGVLSARNAWS